MTDTDASKNECDFCKQFDENVTCMTCRRCNPDGEIEEFQEGGYDGYCSICNGIVFLILTDFECCACKAVVCSDCAIYAGDFADCREDLRGNFYCSRSCFEDDLHGKQT